MFSGNPECPWSQSELCNLFAGESLHWVIQIIVVFHTLLSSEYLFSFCELSHSNTFTLTCGEGVLCLTHCNENSVLSLLACALQFRPLEVNYWDFPGGPVVKTLPSQYRGPGFDPWSGKLDPACCLAQPKKTNRRKTKVNYLVIGLPEKE